METFQQQIDLFVNNEFFVAKPIIIQPEDILKMKFQTMLHEQIQLKYTVYGFEKIVLNEVVKGL